MMAIILVACEKATGELAQGDALTLGDADFRKSLMMMIYRKLPKSASLPAACQPGSVVLDHDFLVLTGVRKQRAGKPNQDIMLSEFHV